MILSINVAVVRPGRDGIDDISSVLEANRARNKGIKDGFKSAVSHSRSARSIVGHLSSRLCKP